MKLLYIDLETTGIAVPDCGVIQIAGLIEIDGKICEQFDLHVEPFSGDRVEEDALAMQGLTRRDLAQFPSPAEIFKTFTELLARYVDPYNKQDKFHLVAYNASFDVGHLRAWFEKNGDRFFGSWFWHPPIDVMGLAAAALIRERPGLPDFKLATVAGFLGIAVDDAQTHDSLYDVELMQAVYYQLSRPDLTREAPG